MIIERTKQEGKKMKVWTKEEVKENLEKSDRWVIRAVLALYARQTEHEQALGATAENNSIGFNGADAPYLSWVARELFGQGKAPAKTIDKCRKRITKYSGQLAAIANGC
jgi:hypothetical protein